MRRTSALVASLALTVFAAPAWAGTIDVDFDTGKVHGEIIDSDYSGVTISAAVNGVSPDYAIIFNSNFTGTTTDDDLIFGGAWAGGNAQSEDLENLLILSENTVTKPGFPDIIDDPDDEGSRRAGSLTFDFGSQYLSAFGLSIVDIENQTQEGSSVEFFDGATSLLSIDFVAFKDGGTYDQGASWGNRSANRISPLTTSTLGTSSFNKVVVNFGGSGAIGDVTATMVPLPPAAWMGLGLLGVLGIARRRRRQQAI